jgi:SAM-dependent methyltransferase
MNFYCPKCLSIKAENKLSHIQDNALECSSCGMTFPIISNIPRLTNLSNYSESFGYQWNIYRLTQLDSYTKTKISEDRVKNATGWSDLNSVTGNLLEAGSGAGRFTEVLAKIPGQVYSFDFSNSVEANFKNNGSSKNLTIFQGDIYNIPFKDEFFDHVFCLGVIQHTPDPEESFKSLARKVKPGGFLYIDHYALKWHHPFQWKYILRPITKRMNKEYLFKIISFLVPLLIPFSKLFKMLLGPYGERLIPIKEFSQLGLTNELNKEWAILDTFDMYSPEHDHPRRIKVIKSWFVDIGFEKVEVFYGDNGIVARARKPS